MSNWTANKDTMDYSNSTPVEETVNVTDDQDHVASVNLEEILNMIDIATMCIELPVLCWAVFVLCHQVKAGYATPIYVINLLISDFVQIIGRILWEVFF